MWLVNVTLAVGVTVNRHSHDGLRLGIGIVAV